MPTERTGQGPAIREIPPTRCPNGHTLRRPNVQVIWLGCTCAGGRGHRAWRCWTCGALVYEPLHTGDQQSTGESADGDRSDARTFAAESPSLI